MKFKYRILIIIYFIFCIFDCCFSNIPNVSSLYSGSTTKLSFFFDMHGPISNYMGYLKLLIAYMLPILLGIYFVQDKNTSFIIMRYSTRTKYKRIELFKIIYLAVGFSVIHQLVDIIFTLQLYNLTFLKKYSFLTYSLLSIIILSLFYIGVGFIYQIIKDLVKTDLFAFLAIIIINFSQFAIIKFDIGSFWIPGRNISEAFGFLSKQVSSQSIVFAILRSILFVIILYFISQMTFDKKDIIKNEK